MLVCIFLSCLMAMHLYWYSLLFKGTLKKVRGEELVDVQNDISKLVKNKKQ